MCYTKSEIYRQELNSFKLHIYQVYSIPEIVGCQAQCLFKQAESYLYRCTSHFVAYLSNT